jgi:Ca2+-binding EF-hand superfamily protein
MRAFRAFDPEGKGYIDGEYLKNMLMTRGDAFRPKEAQEMLAAVEEEASGHIYYEDFAALLANDGRAG